MRGQPCLKDLHDAFGRVPVAKWVFGRPHSLVLGRIVKQSGRFADDPLAISADDHGGAAFHRFWPFGYFAEHKDRLSE